MVEASPDLEHRTALIRKVDMRRKGIFLFICVLALSMMMCQCPLTGALSNFGGQVSDELRNEVLTSVLEFHDSLPTDGDPEEGKQALIEYMSSLDGMEFAGIMADGSVWGEFTDGRLLMLAQAVPAPAEDQEAGGSFSPSGNSLLLRPSSTSNNENLYLAGYSPLHQNRNPDTRLAGGEGPNLPESSTAVVMSALADIYGGEWDTIQGYLEEKNYDVSNPLPDVSALRSQVTDVGVMYFATHGAFGLPVDDKGYVLEAAYVPDDFTFENTIFGLMTSTTFSSANEASFSDDLNNLRLVYFNKVEDLGRGMKLKKKFFPDLHWSYAITGRFVEKYMSFSENSFVFIGACSSFDESMINAFSSSNASVYAGWTAPVGGKNATLAPLTVFQLLLGVEGQEEASRPYRPFEHASIWGFLQDRRLNIDSGIRRYAVLKVTGENKVILAPSIRWMDVFEDDEELHLEGMFGDTPGKVTINHEEVSIVGEWSPDKIIVELPPIDSSNGYGDVIVTVNDHESNAVPLTLWEGEFTYTIVAEEMWAPGLEQRAEVEIAIRADVHEYREKPGDEPDYRDSVKFTLPEDLSGQWSFEGTGKKGSCAEFELSGGGDLEVEREAEGSAFYNAWGEIHPKDQEIEMHFSPIVGPDAGGTITLTDTCGDSTAVTLPQMLVIVDMIIKPIQIKMDDQFVIQEDEKTSNTVFGQDIGAMGTLEWDSITPEFPPDEEYHASLIPVEEFAQPRIATLWRYLYIPHQSLTQRTY